jgi:hypothetical protein
LERRTIEYLAGRQQNIRWEDVRILYRKTAEYVLKMGDGKLDRRIAEYWTESRADIGQEDDRIFDRETAV